MLSHICSECKMLHQALPAASVKRSIGSDNIYAAMSRLICPYGTPCCRQRRRGTLKRAYRTMPLRLSALYCMHVAVLRRSLDRRVSVVAPRPPRRPKKVSGHGGHGAPEIDAKNEKLLLRERHQNTLAHPSLLPLNFAAPRGCYIRGPESCPCGSEACEGSQIRF